MSRPPARREAFAAAKVNLFLHVGPRGADGYHPLASLMVFAALGDRVSVQAADAPPLTIEGPFAEGLSAGPDNLVLQARAALGADASLLLQKELPLASGLGGGSADAAATLRLLNPLIQQPLTPSALAAVAARLGADAPACLESRPLVALGRGEQLLPAPRLPALNAVLVNPGAESPTADVFRAFDAGEPTARADLPELPSVLETVGDVVELLARTRNDLEAPAIRLRPVTGEVLRAVGDAPETLFARMSGSGATVFGLCVDAEAAQSLAARLTAGNPGWWVRSCRLGGPWA